MAAAKKGSAISRLKLGSDVKIADCFIPFAVGETRGSAAFMRFGRHWVQARCFFEVGDGIVVLVKLVSRMAAMFKKVRIRRVMLDCGCEVVDRFAVFALSTP